MMDALHFTFESGPHFLGVLVLIVALVIVPLLIIGEVVGAFARKRP